VTSVVLDPVRTATPAPADRARRRAGTLRLGVSSRVYVPACSVAAVAAALIAIGWLDHWGGGSFTASMTDVRVVVAGPAALAIFGFLMVVERLRPAQRRPLFARGHRQDVLYVLLNATLVVPLVAALSLSFAHVVRTSLPWLVLGRIDTVPRWAAIAVIFVAMDALNWLAHLLNHKVRVLWRFHELHHSQEDMNCLTVLRTHPLIHVSYLIALVPGIVLIANGAVSTTILVAYGAVVGFAHSNTNFGFGPLNRLFVSPNYHRQHHRLDGRQDVNLGFAFTVWDQLSKRAVFPTPETIRVDTGLPGRPLVVENEGDRPHHLAVFGRQLLAPFRPMDRNDPSSMSPNEYPGAGGSTRDEATPEW
jgi:sterol desaturase/sphingolipid hydroxylase (fatty acid hydroxylase superfamily)